MSPARDQACCGRSILASRSPPDRFVHGGMVVSDEQEWNHTSLLKSESPSEQDAFQPVPSLISCTSSVNQTLFISQREHFLYWHAEGLELLISAS